MSPNSETTNLDLYATPQLCVGANAYLRHGVGAVLEYYVYNAVANTYTPQTVRVETDGMLMCNSEYAPGLGPLYFFPTDTYITPEALASSVKHFPAPYNRVVCIGKHRTRAISN